MDFISLSPKDQENFWNAIDPDCREILNYLERGESWVIKYDEMPDAFRRLSAMLPDIVSLEPDKEIQEIFRNLIKIIAIMPLRQCISAISCMNFLTDESTSPVGWGTAMHYYAITVKKNYSEDKEFKALANKIDERIKIIVKLNIYADLFINPDLAIWPESI